MHETTSQSTSVSIVIASFNQGPYIEQAVHSVLQQNCSEIEILIVDDGSTDQTPVIAKSLQKKHPQTITVLQHALSENKGITETYRLCMQKARGKYIAFLEGDDWWPPDYLSEKIRILDQHPDIGLVFSPYKTVITNYYGLDMALRQWILLLRLPKQKSFDNFQNLIKRNNVATFSAFVVRQSLVEGFSFPQDNHLVFLDWLFLVYLSMKTKFYLDNKSRVFWRQHRGSTMGRQSMSMHQKRLVYFMDYLYQVVSDHSDCLSPVNLQHFKKRREQLPYFTAFYGMPKFKHFTTFFLKDPIWALETLASLVINRIKLWMPG